MQMQSGIYMQWQQEQPPQQQHQQQHCLQQQQIQQHVQQPLLSPQVTEQQQQQRRQQQLCGHFPDAPSADGNSDEDISEVCSAQLGNLDIKCSNSNWKPRKVTFNGEAYKPVRDQRTGQSPRDLSRTDRQSRKDLSAASSAKTRGSIAPGRAVGTKEDAHVRKKDGSCMCCGKCDKELHPFEFVEDFVENERDRGDMVEWFYEIQEAELEGGDWRIARCGCARPTCWLTKEWKFYRNHNEVTHEGEAKVKKRRDDHSGKYAHLIECAKCNKFYRPFYYVDKDGNPVEDGTGHRKQYFAVRANGLRDGDLATCGCKNGDYPMVWIFWSNLNKKRNPGGSLSDPRWWGWEPIKNYHRRINDRKAKKRARES